MAKFTLIHTTPIDNFFSVEFFSVPFYDVMSANNNEQKVLDSTSDSLVFGGDSSLNEIQDDIKDSSAKIDNTGIDAGVKRQRKEKELTTLFNMPNNRGSSAFNEGNLRKHLKKIRWSGVPDRGESGAVKPSYCI